MSYESTTVLVQCSAPSHERTPVHRFRVGRRDGGPWTWAATTQQTLIDDAPLEEQETAALHGTPTRPPNLDALRDKARRLRWTLVCPRCGVRADMRKETAVRVIEGYANAGVFVVDLEALAASL